MYKYILLFAFLLRIKFSFAQSAVDSIKASRSASNSAIARHDIDGMSKYWLKDFVQTIGRGTTLTGSDSVINAWKELFKANAIVSYVRTPTEIIVGDNGIMAWETGTLDSAKLL